MVSYAEHHVPLVHQVGKLMQDALIRRERPAAVSLGTRELDLLKDYPTFIMCRPMHPPTLLGLPVVPGIDGVDLITE